MPCKWQMLLTLAYSDIIEIKALLPLEPLETHTKTGLSIDLRNPESLCVLNCAQTDTEKVMSLKESEISLESKWQI